jgi:hypothetical protein
MSRTGFEPVSLDPDSKEPLSSQPKDGDNASLSIIFGRTCKNGFSIIDLARPPAQLVLDNCLNVNHNFLMGGMRFELMTFRFGIRRICYLHSLLVSFRDLNRRIIDNSLFA